MTRNVLKAVNELLDLRAKLAAGPVMPETTPSHVLDEMWRGMGDVRQVRRALLAEQQDGMPQP